MSVFDSSRAESWLYILGEVARASRLFPPQRRQTCAIAGSQPHTTICSMHFYYGGLFSAAMQTTPHVLHLSNDQGVVADFKHSIAFFQT
jgi:hypothetical protein